MIKNKKLTDYKRRYELVRHHAWAGLGFLSVLLAVRALYPEISDLLQPILVLIIIYIFVSLLLTYRYYKGLSASMLEMKSSNDIQNDRKYLDIEKKDLKIEKKKAKAKAKSEKKSTKNKEKGFKD